MLLGMSCLNLKKKLSVVFAPTRKPDAGQNPGATKIPLPLRAGDKNGNNNISAYARRWDRNVICFCLKLYGRSPLSYSDDQQWLILIPTDRLLHM